MPFLYESPVQTVLTELTGSAASSKIGKASFGTLVAFLAGLIRYADSSSYRLQTLDRSYVRAYSRYLNDRNIRLLAKSLFRHTEQGLNRARSTTGVPVYVYTTKPCF
eukprot:IDg8212t1